MLTPCGIQRPKSNPHLYGYGTPKTPNALLGDNHGAHTGAARRLHSPARMITILCVIGGVWAGGAALFVLALALAARKPAPVEESETMIFKQAA